LNPAGQLRVARLMNNTASLREPRSLVALGVFLVLVIGVGALIGMSSSPDSWYESLTKPPFNPPNWVFGPVWFTLYVLIAIAGWRVWMRGERGAALGLWAGQMLFNWAWSPAWFILHQTWLAFAILVAMWLCIVGFMLVNWRQDDRVSALLFVPYLAWVSFAGLLNLWIALAN
jgi:benzodiazapine receptor